jgi:hypothetical protein
MAQQLDQQLAALKAQAQTQTATYQTSRDQLHQAIVDAYLWWRDAQAQPNYLDTTYAAAGIKSRKRSSNSPNFYPLVRLVWNIDISKQAGTVSNWARSMLALHEEYAANTKLYAKNPRADLLNFVKDEGGLGGIRGERTMTADELAAEEQAGLPQETRGRPKVTAPPPANVTKSKLDTAKAVSAKAVISSFPTAVTNADNLVVMLGRRNAAGKIEVIGSDYSEDLVQVALNTCTALDRSTVAPSLRLLAEALEPHALPSKLEKYRQKFFDDSEVERTVTLKELDDKGQPKTQVQRVKQATRLRYRPSTKGFLVSKTATPASIASYVTPHKPFDCADEVILRGEDRSWIERELLNQQKLTLYTASPEQGLEETDGTVKASHVLNLEDAEAAHTRRLYFYEKSTVPVETNEQPIALPQATATWDWQLETTVQWLAEFDAQCATPYVNKIRGFFNRSQFASLQLQIGKTDLELRYWLDEKSKAYAESYTLPYKTNAKRIDKPAKTQLFTANAKDLALVFAVLPTLPITSSHVLLAGNEHVMRITYSTELAAYETYIPAADAAGARDATAFEMYGA